MRTRLSTTTMTTRIASILLALALPLIAQDGGNSAAPDAETMFYKAFYLEKGQRDFAGAMALYEQFLAKAPEHKLAGEAARQQFRLLDATGKTKERDAFKAKYEKLLGNVAAAAPTPAVQERPARGEGGERPARGEGGAQGGRPDMAARMAELEKKLADAKAAGNADEVKNLEQQIERMKSMGNRGQGGPGGGRGRGGLMGALMGGKPVAEMSDEELGQLKSGIEQSSQMIEMMRERNPEQADKLEKGVAELKKALDAGDKAGAQTALDALKSAMPARGGRGGRGGQGGGGNAGGGGGNAGGGGGNAGGGGGGGN